MCGIVGAYDLLGQRDFPKPTIEIMTAALRHRGPDDTAYFSAPGISMGVQRLALNDVARGQQPMSDGAITVAVNGELFDHPLERERLSDLGHDFRTHCDTEVWLHGWRQHGTTYLERARGQFATAVYSSDNRELVLARDRFGICPLFVTKADGWLLWASEIKGLLASGYLEPRLDIRAVDHLMTLMCAGPARSAFEGVTPIRPGHFLRVDPRGQQIQRRFAGIDFPDADPAPRLDAEKLTQTTGEILTAAVQRRLRADTPVATYLSGGIDSSLIAAIAARATTEPVTAFTVGLDGVGPDETEAAREVAQTFGMEHVVVSVNTQVIHELFPKVVLAAEGPILDHASTCMLALSRAAQARGFKAVLSGEGADEAFAGYPWHHFHSFPRGTRWLRSLGVAGLASLVGGRRGRLARGGREYGPAQAPIYNLLARSRTHLYADDFWERLGDWTPAQDHQWDHRALSRLAPLNQSLLADYRMLLAGHLMIDKGDRVAMASGVEGRFPFLDEAFVDFAAGLPLRYKLRGRSNKWLLRRMAEGILGSRISNRPKHVFRANPVIHGEVRPVWVDQLLSDESLKRTALFDPAKVRQSLERRVRPRKSLRDSLLEAGLTGVVSTQLLHHLFFGGQLCELPIWTAPSA